MPLDECFRRFFRYVSSFSAILGSFGVDSCCGMCYAIHCRRNGATCLGAVGIAYNTEKIGLFFEKNRLEVTVKKWFEWLKINP